MSTINYIKICVSQRREDLDPPLPSNKIFRKKQDPDLARSERRIARSEYRSNQCPVCFTARSSNGSCACE